MKKLATLAALKPRDPNSSIGSMGAGARSSQATKAASSRPPTAIESTTWLEVHPTSLPRTSPSTTPKSPRLASTRPRPSNPLAGPWVSASRSRASGIRRIPIGTFSQKIHFHEIPWTIAPPTTGPSAMAIPPTAPPALGRDGGGEDGEGERRHDGGAHPLDHPSEDQRRRVGRDGRGGRSQREDG